MKPAGAEIEVKEVRDRIWPVTCMHQDLLI